MPIRNILTISPLSLLWYEEEGSNNIIIKHFYTKRNIILERKQTKIFWVLLSEYSDFKAIKENFLSTFTENDLISTINLLNKIGIIKTYKK